MLTRCLFALLALAALVVLFAPPPGVVPESEPWLRKLLLAEISLLSAGMAVPWGRWMPFVSPGGSLAFVTKLLGWSGASGLPYCLFIGAWLAAGICALLPVFAFALWKGFSWAAWPWYAVALGAFGISIAIAIETGPGVVADVEQDLVVEGVMWILFRYVVPAAWILFWGGIGFVLAREVTIWRRRLQSQGAAPGSPSAS